MSANNFSAVIITHRQDQRLKKTLNSISFADEVVVIDHRPKKTDWPQWLKPDQIKILPYPQPINNFAQIRNWAMDQTKHDWVLFIDSDEWFQDPKLAQQLIKSVLNQPKKAWKIQRQDLFLGHYLNFGEAGKQWHTRLINKKYSQFTRPVHEVIETDGPVGRLSLKLIHQAHLSLTEFWNDISRYAALEAEYRHLNSSHQSLIKIFIKLVTFPPAKFCLNYFFKLGLLDKKPGLIYALMMSLHSALVRIFQLELILKKQ